MSYDITKSQLEILNVMWAAGEPLSRGDILERSSDKSWKGSSIHILLNGLLEKGLIEGAGFTRAGKVWGRLYAPTITVEEYYASILKAGPVCDRVRLLKLILDGEELDKKTADAMVKEIKNARAAKTDKADET